MSQPHVIVWDLDLTLGDFTELEKHPESQAPVMLLFRPGIDAALQRLGAAGFVHTILTVGTKFYADLVLQGSGLAKHFALIDGRDNRPKGDAAGIAQHFGIAEADRPHRMFFVGDRLMFDQPADNRVVFHLELQALSRPAEQLERLILAMRREGSGSLREGFDRIGSQRTGWRRWWPVGKPMPIDSPVNVTFAGLPPILFVARSDDGPVLGFEKPPEPAVAPDEVAIVPAEVASRLPTT